MDIDQTDVALAALDPADVRPIEVSPRRKLFLGNAKIIALRSHAFAESP